MARLGLAAVLAYGLLDGVTYTTFFVIAFLGFERSTGRNPATDLKGLLSVRERGRGRGIGKGGRGEVRREGLGRVEGRVERKEGTLSRHPRGGHSGDCASEFIHSHLPAFHGVRVCQAFSVQCACRAQCIIFRGIVRQLQGGAWCRIAPHGASLGGTPLELPPQLWLHCCALTCPSLLLRSG